MLNSLKSIGADKVYWTTAGYNYSFDVEKRIFKDIGVHDPDVHLGAVISIDICIINFSKDLESFFNFSEYSMLPV